ncbi:chemotaxis protein CheD [Aliifodinibius salipaludis]|uniref:Probable chemoreceptor glutamine deamidase CheD n=1 Tax=Fodinibius salipaludis TaxID=2032627 RepID=A0A2A2GDS1_9BACT|nr:chemotaxis protein CheD [Aliifodinibius salipaludis]PAU94995.1 chemotaxis protein CheD [Aliifodinibius salipaludis]
MKTVVGVSDYRVSGNTDETIITYALGSCLGIAAYDPTINVGGLLHVMLPLSKADPEKAKLKPAMYVDTGFQLLLDEIYDLGAKKRNIKITVAGGASMRAKDREDYFKIGKRNITVIRKLLWKNRFMISSGDVGGNISRTMALRIADGYITINKKPIGVNK